MDSTDTTHDGHPDEHDPYEEEPMAAIATHPRWARLGPATPSPARPLRSVPAPPTGTGPDRRSGSGSGRGSGRRSGTARPVGPRAGSRVSPAVLRRRRLVTVAVLVLLAFLAGAALALALTSPAGGSLTDEAREAQQVTYVVQSGDTLWRAAAELAPGEDPRVVVDALAASRGTSTIVPGDVLAWPID